MRVVCYVAAMIVLSNQAWSQKPEGQWTATSTASLGVTGNIRVSPTLITFQKGKSLVIQDAGTVTVKAITGESTQGQLYRVTSQTNPVLLQGSYLCGREVPKWIVLLKTKRIGGDVDSRSLMVYDTPQRPPAASSCAIYNYDAGQ